MEYLAKAVAEDDLVTIKWLFQEKVVGRDASIGALLTDAFKAKKFGVVKLLIDETDFVTNDNCEQWIRQAIDADNLVIVKLIGDNCYVPSTAITWAIKAGQVETLKYLMTKCSGVPIGTFNDAIRAPADVRLKMVKHLYGQGYLPYDDSLIVAAIHKQSLEVVNFLCRECKLSRSLIEFALERAIELKIDSDIVDCLKSYLPPVVPPVETVTPVKPTETVTPVRLVMPDRFNQWFVSCGLIAGSSTYEDLTEMAFKTGNIDYIKWNMNVVNKCKKLVPSDGELYADKACRYNSLPVLKWLHDNYDSLYETGCYECTEAGLRVAAQNDNLETFEYLYGHRDEFRWKAPLSSTIEADMLMVAARNGSNKIVTFLVHRTLAISLDDLKLAKEEAYKADQTKTTRHLINLKLVRSYQTEMVWAAKHGYLETNIELANTCLTLRKQYE